MKRFLIIIQLLFLISTVPVKASQYIESEDDLFSFSVKAVLPENQRSELTFFDIEMAAGQEQELEVIITNSSEEEIKVEVSANTAATDSNGVITYDGSITEFDESMQYPFADIAEPVEDVVTVPAQSEASALIKVSAPEVSFDGQILGGLRFMLVEEEADQQDDVSVQQAFAYVIGVNIVEKGNQNSLQPELNLEEVEVVTQNGRTVLQTTFVNPTPVLARNLVFSGAIYPAENQNEVIYQREVEFFSVAPHNIFNFPIVFEEGNLIAGDYVFKATASNDDLHWEFEEAFTIE